MAKEPELAICAKLLSSDFSPDDIGGDIGTMSLRNPDGPEAVAIITVCVEALLSAQKVLLNLADEGAISTRAPVLKFVDAALIRAGAKQ